MIVKYSCPSGTTQKNARTLSLKILAFSPLTAHEHAIHDPPTLYWLRFTPQGAGREHQGMLFQFLERRFIIKCTEGRESII